MPTYSADILPSSTGIKIGSAALRFDVFAQNIDMSGSFTGTFLASNFNNIRYANAFSGANAGSQIVAAIIDLPSTGGTVDARGLEGAQTISQNIFSGVTKPVTLLLGAAAYTVTATQTIPSSIMILGIRGGGTTSRTTLAFSSTLPGLQVTGGVVEIGNLSIMSTGQTDARIGIDVQGTLATPIVGVAFHDLYMDGWNTAVKLQYTQQSVLSNLNTVTGSNGVEFFGQSLNNVVDNCFFTSNGAAGSANVKFTKDGAVGSEGIRITDSLLFGAQYGVYAPNGAMALSLHLSGNIIDGIGTNGLFVQATHGLRVANNWIYSDDIGIRGAAVAIPDNFETSIVGNQITSVNSYGIFIDDNNQGWSVADNSINYDGNFFGVLTNTTASDITIHDNNMIKTGAGAGQAFRVVGAGVSIVDNFGNTGVVWPTFDAGSGRNNARGNVGQGGFSRLGPAIPTAGTWIAGDIIWNDTPTAGGILGWVCVTGGTPGTWVAIPASASNTNAWTIPVPGPIGGTTPNTGAFSTLGVGVATPVGKTSVVSSDTGTGFTINTWDGKYSVFGPNAGSTTGAALGMGYSSTDGAADIVAIQPGTAWKPIRLVGSTLTIYPGGGTSVFSAGVAGITLSQTAGIVGTTTNNNANAGSVGEFLTANTAAGTTSLTTNVSADATSISLTAGDWDVDAVANFTFDTTTSFTNLSGGLSTVSATLGAQDTYFDYETPAAIPTAAKVMTWVVPRRRISIAGTTTVYLVTQGTFTASFLKVGGTIQARRVR